MKKTKKALRYKTIFIKDGEMLEQVKEMIHEPLWGYDETYKDDASVSSGYLHYSDGLFYLSKSHFDKEILTYAELEHQISPDFYSINGCTYDLKLAKNYFSADSELSTQKMFKAIYNNSDKTQMIDHIDGVEVCEQFEYTFTCKDFIEHIEQIDKIKV